MSVLDKYRKKYKELKENSGGGDFDELEMGKNYRRFFASCADGSFYLEGSMHSNLSLLGVDSDVAKAAVCPRGFNPKAKCPICDAVKELADSRDPKDQEAVKSLKAKPRYWSWVAALEDVDSKTGEVRVLSFGPMILQPLLGFATDPDYGEFTDLEEGRNVTIERTGKGRDTEYETRMRPKVSSFQAPGKELTPLEEVIVPRTFEELEGILNNIKPEDKRKGKKEEGKDKGKKEEGHKRHAREEEEEEEDNPKSKGKKAQEEDDDEPKGKGKKAKEEDDEEEDDGEKKVPKCFGEEYMPRSEKCKECGSAKACRNKFLGV